MPLSEAKSLVSKATQRLNAPLFVQQHDPTADLYAIEKLADEMDSFSPIVGLQQEVDYPNCIFLEVTGLTPLFGSESELAEQIYRFCQRQGYWAHVAIASTVAQAQGAAQVSHHHWSHLQTQSQTESAASTLFPKAIRVVQQPDTFHAFPVTTLRLPHWITTTLNQLGIGTISQLLSLPRRDLSARFGKQIHQRLDQMSGKVSEPIVSRKPLPEYHAEKLLEHPTSHQETIEVILERLIEDICEQLTSAQQGALQWTIRFYCQDHQLPLKLHVSLFQPSTTAEHIVQLARMQWEQLLHAMETEQATRKTFGKSRWPKSSLAFEVNEITVTVSSCVLVTQRQRNLFDENPRLDKQSLAHLINRLSGRLGRENVAYPALISGAQPEHAFQMRPLINPYSRGPRRIASETNSHPASHVISRPIKVFRPAIPISIDPVVDNETTDRNVPPALLYFLDDRHKVIGFWGPERIETGWWRGPTVRRDYWRVETETHQQFWIYRDLRRRHWFLQGVF